MNLDNCAVSISSEASSSLPACEPSVDKSPDPSVRFKILKSKSSDSSSLDNNCSPAKKCRLDDDTNQPTSSGVSSCSQENEPPSLAESSSLASSSNCSSNITSLFKNAHAQHNKPLKNNDIQNPRQLLCHLVPSLDVSKIPANLDDFDICRLVYKLMSAQNSSDSKQIDLDNLELPSSSLALNHASAISSLFLTQREKLPNVNTIEDCVDLIAKSKNIIVLTGAGCSVSCGIPDFRSRDGVYARLRVDFPDLPDPQSMFDIFYFEHDPRPFFKFAKEIYPGQFRPSLSHMFIKNLEQSGRLLRNYTQNIDTLELTADIKNVIQCHGSFATATCTQCKYKVNSDYIKDKILRQEIPYCDKCSPNEPPSPGILKPDIVFFGEGLPEEYHNSINDDKNQCDLLIVIGSSLKVKPVANIPHLLPKQIPQILINRESLKHMNFDVELLGDCDVITNELLMRLNHKIGTEHDWSVNCKEKSFLNKIEDDQADKFIFHSPNQSDTSPNDSIDSSCSNKVINRDYLKENSFVYLKPNVYVFHGAEVSLKSMRKKLKRLRSLLSGQFKEELDEEDFDTEDEFSSEDETEDDDDDDDDDEDDDDEEEGNGKGDTCKPDLNGIIDQEEYDEENDEDFRLDEKEDFLKEQNKFS
ncbi:NAD-dependent deacetylase sirtuin-1-like [Brachionus plicatilis]|uniref:protein acetyllysine N-acetyltransferase n=1 Tax=Brachionus plicatilis TaxID=10195 RepID=A0A3M7PTE5_BRAPC|nr:NAD-dependent deacetylase sirtuin-1-like [Brachionus plicatilis]